MTQHFTGNKLYEYANLARFDSANANYSKQYTIQDLFYGTGGAMYRGAFFYHRYYASLLLVTVQLCS